MRCTPIQTHDNARNMIQSVEDKPIARACSRTSMTDATPELVEESMMTGNGGVDESSSVGGGDERG